MSTFKNREQAHEKQFEHEQELQFRIRIRQAKLAGLWAAEQLGLPESEAKTYANELVRLNVDSTKGLEAIGAKLKADFQSHNVALSDRQLSKQLDSLLILATEQIRQQ